VASVTRARARGARGQQHRQPTGHSLARVWGCCCCSAPLSPHESTQRHDRHDSSQPPPTWSNGTLLKARKMESCGGYTTPAAHSCCRKCCSCWPYGCSNSRPSTRTQDGSTSRADSCGGWPAPAAARTAADAAAWLLRVGGHTGGAGGQGWRPCVCEVWVCAVACAWCAAVPPRCQLGMDGTWQPCPPWLAGSGQQAEQAVSSVLVLLP
jgi:hypothetical protein